MSAILLIFGLWYNIKNKSINEKGVLAINWKAYELEEPYVDFLKAIDNLDGDYLDVYLSPVATELKELKDLI